VSAGREVDTERVGVALFYVVFLALSVGEGAFAHVVDELARRAGAGSAGPYIAWVAFVLGGASLGMYELWSVTSDRQLRDPILGACCYLQRRLGGLGFLINAIVLGGAPGTAVALKKAGAPRQRSGTVVAAALFATVWVPLYLWLWR
jgi:hypothetical protein